MQNLNWMSLQEQLDTDSTVFSYSSFSFSPLQAALGTYASMGATCHWTVSRVMGFPRSACRASPRGARPTPAKGTNVAPLSPASTCGECTNAGTHTNPKAHSRYCIQSSAFTLRCCAYTLILLTQRHKATYIQVILGLSTLVFIFPHKFMDKL